MLNNILGKSGEKKEVDDEEIKKLRQQFKEIAKEQNIQGNSGSQPDASTQEINQNNAGSGNINNNTSNNNNNSSGEQYVDPERLEENERITNLIMQQIKELIEIDNNLNVKIKEIETKLKNNMTATQDVKNVVDKFHQRLEFIEKNMEKFMGLYEVVTNRFNPFVEEEEKENIENPKAKEGINIPDVGLNSNNNKENENADNNNNDPQQQQAQQTQMSGSTENNNSSNQMAGAQNTPVTQSLNQEDNTNEQNINASSNTATQGNTQTQNPQKPVQEQVQTQESEGMKIITEAGVKGKLDKEVEDYAAEKLESIFSSIAGDQNARKNVIEKTTKGVNKLVVDAIKGHSKVTKEQIDEMVKTMSSELGGSINTGAANSAGNEGITGAQRQVGDGANSNQGIQSHNNDTGNQENKATTEVPAEYHFSLPDGTVIKSVSDLREALKTMDQETFSQHVNESGNDFGQWLSLALGDNDLGEKFSMLKDRQEMISELEKIS